MRGSKLIEHLEQGGLLATGCADRLTFLRLERWENNTGLHQRFGVYGWGSVHGSAAGRLMEIITNPEIWFATPDAENAKLIETLAMDVMMREGRFDRAKGRFVRKGFEDK